MDEKELLEQLNNEVEAKKKEEANNETAKISKELEDLKKELEALKAEKAKSDEAASFYKKYAANVLMGKAGTTKPAEEKKPVSYFIPELEIGPIYEGEDEKTKYKF